MKQEKIPQEYMTAARNLVDDKFRVIFGFDGAETVDTNRPGEWKRAVGWGGDQPTFSWKRFLTLEDSYNPLPGQLNPWSLKTWYKWGCRKFHFHNPFGKVARGKSQELVYEIDQFLNAKNGLTIGSEVQNTKMPWLVNDFVAVIKALTTGQQGTLDQATWESWVKGEDAWFNPAEPIDLIVYVGSLAEPAPNDIAYERYIARWEERFTASPTAALARLKASVQPLIDANCRIGFDAVCVAAGPEPGKYVPFEKQSLALQKGWWAFWTWINSKVGKDRIYIESHPFYRYGHPNPYLGWNVIADDDWSTSQCCISNPASASGPHMTSEMGGAEFIRCLWQGAPSRTPLVGKMDSDGDVHPERYHFLEGHESVVRVKSDFDSDSELRLSPPTCCAPGHNYYWYDLMGNILAYHMIEKQNIRGETRPHANFTRSSLMVSNSILQVLPPAYPGDKRHGNQFGLKYPSKDAFVILIAESLMGRNTLETTLYAPR